MADSSERELSPEQEQLITHLRDAHAIEEQSKRQLERAKELAKDSELEQIYSEHLERTEEHSNMIHERIEAYDLKPSAVRDLTMRAGTVGLRQLADVPPDTPVKLAMHFYALEQLEVATYEFLVRIAKSAGDDETAEVAEKILGEEREAAQKICESFDQAVESLMEHAKEAASSEGEGEDEGEGEGEDDSEDSTERESEREPEASKA